MRLRLTPLVLQVLLLLGLPAWAAADEAKVSVQFKVMAVSNGLNGINYGTGGKYVPLDLLPFQYLDKDNYSYSGNATMGLFRLSKVDGKSEMVRIGGVRFPDGASGKFLVVIAGLPGGPASGSALSMNGHDFPAQSVRVFNVTPLTLNIMLNTTGYSLKPFGFNVTPVTGDHYGVSVRMTVDGEVSELTNGLYPITSTSHSTVFVVLTNAAKIAADPKTTPQLLLTVMNETVSSQ
jgi:hypothetical protein